MVTAINGEVAGAMSQAALRAAMAKRPLHLRLVLGVGGGAPACFDRVSVGGVAGERLDV